MRKWSRTHFKVVNVALTLRARARLAAPTSPNLLPPRVNRSPYTPANEKQTEDVEIVCWCGPRVGEAREMCRQIKHENWLQERVVHSP
jgi:hypothetical protein